MKKCNKVITPKRFSKNLILLILFVPLVYSCSQGSISNLPDGNTPPDSTGNNKDASIHLVWDSSTLTEVSAATSGASYNDYARLIQLEDGTLLCVYETAGNIVAVRSNDQGATWSDTLMIAAKSQDFKMSNPDLLKLNDGSLLLTYNQRALAPYNPSKRFAIRTMKSYDGGKTWTDKRLVYQCGYRYQNGCWEPSAVQLPNGEIQLFFSNETMYTSSGEQNISLLRSNDGGLTWTDKPEIVSFVPGARDGMPVPIVLEDKREVVFAIESNMRGKFKIYTIRSSFKNDWASTVGKNSPNRDYALAHKLSTMVYAGAPYLVQLKSGKTLLSYQGTRGRHPNSLDGAVMRVAIGNEEARNFKHISTPFSIPAGSVGLWNGLAVLNDGTIIALTSTNAYSSINRLEVWMIKGHIEKK